MIKRIVLLVIAIAFLVNTVSAITWTSANGCWTATDGADTIVMWNATVNSTWTIPNFITNVQYLVVAGGGGGAGTTSGGSGVGGGGAGGFQNGTLIVTPGSVVSVTVGDGGAGGAQAAGNGGLGNKGGNSNFSSINASGGGGGGGTNFGGSTGGSGGGNGNNNLTTPASGIAGQGNRGGIGANSNKYPGGGGGGAGTVGVGATGTTGGNGGNGSQSNITGTLTYYAGGGGGGSDTGGTAGTGGLGGGGNGQLGTGTGTNGTDGLGGGGGGRDASNPGIGYRGGSGIVIVRYTVSSGTPITSSFTQNLTSGSFSPQAITFNDTSTGSPTTWNWSFGNQRNSTSQNPSSVYYTAGLYPTFLNVTNATGGSSTSYSSFNLTTDLTTFTKSWMQFNNATVIDLLGNAWSQVNGAATTATQSKFGGQSLDLTTNTAYISTASSPALNFSTGDFELEFWIYPTTPHTGNIISRTAATGGSTTGGWAFYSSGTGTSGYSFWMGSVANVSPSFTIPSNQWSWIKIERQSGTIKIYNNGILNSTISQPGNYDTANPLYIGRSSGPVSEACYIDEFRLSNGNSLDIGNDSSPYAQYNGNLFVNYVNINPYATLLYKSWPSPATPPIYNATGRNRTPQLTGFVNATNITFSTTFDSLHVKALGAIRNTTDYPDINIVSDVIDNVNGLETISIGRAAGITPATNATRINLCDQQMAYVNYTTDQTYNMFYGAANITDGQHSVTYPIVNFYATPVTFGTWPNPVVSFSANNVTPFTGQTVTFTDASTNFPNAWNWSFGDSSVSTLQNPTHSYATTGLKTVSLISYQYANASITGNLTQTNYINVSALPVSGFNRQDLVMSPFYTLTITFADSATNAPIPIVSVTDSAGNSFTTTNGTFIESYPFSTVVIYASATGYTSKSASYVMDSDQVQTVQMVAATPTPAQSTWYTPKQIGITVVYYDPAGVNVPNANISLAAIGSSLQDNSQLQTMYGINPTAANQMVNGTLLMNTITGSDGAAAFTVLSSIRYTATVTDPKTNIQYVTELHPGKDPYTIWIGKNPLVLTPSIEQSLNGTQLYISQPDPGNVTLNLQYCDTSGSTTDVHFVVKYASNMTVKVDQDLGNPGIICVLANDTHKNIRGQGYYYYWNASRSV